MIRRPPRSTLTTHSFPTRLSSDLHRSQCVRHLVNRKILWNIAVDARAKRVEHHLAVPGRGDYDDANLGVFDAQVAQAFALAHSRQAEIDRYKVDRSPRPPGDRKSTRLNSSH